MQDLSESHATDCVAKDQGAGKALGCGPLEALGRQESNLVLKRQSRWGDLRSGSANQRRTAGAQLGNGSGAGHRGRSLARPAGEGAEAGSGVLRISLKT